MREVLAPIALLTSYCSGVTGPAALQVQQPCTASNRSFITVVLV